MLDKQDKRLLYILHRGLVEIRLLAMQENRTQIHCLSDILEMIPRIITKGKLGDMEILRHEFLDYKEKHPQSFDYLAYMDEYDVPDL